MTFNQVLETIDRFPLEEQETLAQVLQRRIIELKRERLARDMRDAEKDFQASRCRAVTPDVLMREILA